MTAFFISVFFIYCSSVLVLAWNWFRMSRQKAIGPATEIHFISVVIPFRDEAGSVSALLKSIGELDYPHTSFEVIMVDDHSDDVTSQVLLEKKPAHLNFRIAELPAASNGKKAALDWGIRQAKGKIIVTTDADVSLPAPWLTRINSHFQSEKIKMLAGAVRIQPSKALFSKIQALEFASLIGTSGATMEMNHPTMCNGANLAFLKSAYEEVKGYEGNMHLASGDDEFLMRKVDARWKHSVKFLFDSDAVVTTHPQLSINTFIHQRLRWASKWKHNSSWLTKMVALFVLGFHFSFLLFFVFIVSGYVSLLTAAGLWSVKMLAELLFLYLVCSHLRLKWSWVSFFLLQFGYSFYVVGIGVLSQWRGYSWKGRRWSPEKP